MQKVGTNIQKKVQQFVHIQFYPKNVANPRMIGTINMTLNTILVLIIIIHAQGFEPIKIFGGEGD